MQYLNSVKIDPIGILPTEIMTHTLSYLSPRDLSTCELLSKEWWQNISKNNYLWKKMADRFQLKIINSLNFKLEVLNHIKECTDKILINFPSLPKIPNLFIQQKLIIEKIIKKNNHYNYSVIESAIKLLLNIGAELNSEHIDSAAINGNITVVNKLLEANVSMSEKTLDLVIANGGTYVDLKPLLIKNAKPTVKSLDLAVQIGVSYANIDLLLLAALDNGVAPLQTTIDKCGGYSIATNELMYLMLKFHNNPSNEEIKKKLLKCVVSKRRFCFGTEKGEPFENLGMRCFQN